MKHTSACMCYLYLYFFFFFFLMIRRPPRSTLFPYTRSSDLLERVVGVTLLLLGGWVLYSVIQTLRGGGEFHMRSRPAVSGSRSEEHTSELQSLAYLVCRLLLEKKKKHQSTTRDTNTTTTSHT